MVCTLRGHKGLFMLSFCISIEIDEKGVNFGNIKGGSNHFRETKNVSGFLGLKFQSFRGNN